MPAALVQTSITDPVGDLVNAGDYQPPTRAEQVATDFLLSYRNLAADLVDELEAMAEADGITLTEMFRRAVALYKIEKGRRR